ncbi:hypothetical protein [Marinobacter sp.]
MPDMDLDGLAGIVDLCEERGLRFFGPSAAYSHPKPLFLMPFLP